MGSLILPGGSLAYVDSSVLIYSIERHPVFFDRLRPLWSAVQQGGITLATSELSLLEALVLPLRTRNEPLLRDYEKLFYGGSIRLLPIDQPVVRAAAQLRADIPGLKTPDAIHAATAQSISCAILISNDAVFRRIPSVNSVLISEIDS